MSLFRLRRYTRELLWLTLISSLLLWYTNCSKFSAAAGGSNSVASLQAQCVDVTPARRIVMLSRLEYDNTVAAILGDTSNQAQSTFPPEDRVNGYTTNDSALVVDSNLAALIMKAAETIAANAATKETSKIGCTLSANPQANTVDACAAQYINSRGAAFYRRPLVSSEVSDLYHSYLVGFENPYPNTTPQVSGVEMILTTILEAPQFLYRTELGDPSSSEATVKLTQYEIASELSYLATAAPPDTTLLNLAATGALSSPQILNQQFSRLVASPAGQERVEQFIMQWLGSDAIGEMGSASGPITAALATDMKTETQDYIQHVVFNSTGTLNELFTAKYTYVNSPLANYYGITPADSTNNFNRVTTPFGQGIFSQGSFLVTSATSGVPILHRGHIIRSQILCEQLPSFASLGLGGFTPPPLDVLPSETTRQALANAIPQGTNCAECHQYFMPIGFAFGNFDSFGRFQPQENGQAIDPSGSISESNSIDPSTGLILQPSHFSQTNFLNESQLSQDLAGNARVQQCFVFNSLEFASGRTDVAQNECGVQKMFQTFQNGGEVLAGFAEYVQSPQFTLRQR